MRTPQLGPAFVALALVGVLAGCRHDGRDLAAPTERGTQPIVPTSTTEDTGDVIDTLPGEELDELGGPVGIDDTMSVSLPFSQGEPIPNEYTCNGEDVSLPVDWFDLPDGTIEVAIEMSDLQAPDYVHWVMAGIDPTLGYIESGEVPVGAIQASNSAGEIGYTGPCPPPGQTHTYLVTLSALDQQVELEDGVDAETLLTAIGAATIQSVTESGTYTG